MSNVSINKFKGVSAMEFMMLPQEVQERYHTFRAIANRVNRGNNSKRSHKKRKGHIGSSPLSVNITAKMKGGKRNLRRTERRRK